MAESPKIYLTLAFRWTCPGCGLAQSAGAFEVAKVGFQSPTSRTEESHAPKVVACKQCGAKYQTRGIDPIHHHPPEEAAG
jgi:transcription elongation factor Elf1